MRRGRRRHGCLAVLTVRQFFFVIFFIRPSTYPLLRQWPPYQAHSQPLPSFPPSHTTHNNIPTTTMHRYMLHLPAHTGVACAVSVVVLDDAVEPVGLDLRDVRLRELRHPGGGHLLGGGRAGGTRDGVEGHLRKRERCGRERRGTEVRVSVAGEMRDRGKRGDLRWC